MHGTETQGAEKAFRGGILARITEAFVDSKITPLLIIASILLGALSIFITPSEEEPQIVVPMIDVMVAMPGASPQEVERRVVTPMEKLLWEIPGVEYVYSTAMDGKALTIVRFEVGEDVERSLVKAYEKLYSHFDWIPPGCGKPILKARSIDDVPIMVLTLWGKAHDPLALRSLAARLDDEIRAIPGVSQTQVIGGLRREVRVILDPQALAALGLDPVDVTASLGSQNAASWITDLTTDNRAFSLRVDGFFKDVRDVEGIIVANRDGRPVFLRDVARIVDGPEEPASYVLIGAGGSPQKAGLALSPGETANAVSLAVSKRKGQNATLIANEVLRKVEMTRGYILPDDVHVTITRDYGETAKQKSDELLEHLAIATISVACLMALLLGIRASLVVLVAIPVTLAFTLFIYYLYGYTLNRVTLFALIFCIGILVDDPIVGVENIVRHLRLPENQGRPFRKIIVESVVEVGSPLVLATFTVIAAILPLAFVRGLMGPYMRPMPVGASVAMFLSMVVTFVITPWAAYHILGRRASHPEEREGRLTLLYRKIMGRLIASVSLRWAFLWIMALLFAASCLLIATKVVKVKMLPFDNKSEFQVIIDMPEGTSLEKTAEVAGELGAILARQPEVTDYELYVGTAAPFNFNGLVRHYYLREGPNVADIQVNLIDRHQRSEQSHPIAKALRPALEEAARRHGARIKVAEIPPGPPVLQTLVAEIYGPDPEGRLKVARDVLSFFESTKGVVDVDWYVADPQPEWHVVVDRDKALTLGVTPERVVETISTALGGSVAGLLHDPSALEDVLIRVRLPRQMRATLHDIEALRVRSSSGALIGITEVAAIRERTIEQPIYHKNLQPVVYVTADVAGEEESPIYAILALNKKLKEYTTPSGTKLDILYTHQPFSTRDWSMKWDGEWHITYEVFRDMGGAFGVVVIIIFVLVVGWFRSYTIPLVILAPIPLSLIGIIPAHAIAGAFFTATSMIGFIAGAGIVVRNSIILVDFIELRLSQGMPLAEAVVDAGAVRFRPMLLTASAVIVGSFVILFDPIFQGLAISLMAGEVAATLFSRMVVPILYYLDHRIKQERRLVL